MVGVASLLIGFWPSTGSAAIYYVSLLGRDTNTCSDAQRDDDQTRQKGTISGGVACLSAGDTLLVHGGIYTGPDNIIDSQVFVVPTGTSWSNPVTIASAPGESFTLMPPFNVGAITLTAGAPHHLIFREFTIDMANTAGPGAVAVGVFLDGGHHIRFDRLEFKNGYGFGFHWGPSSGNNEVLNCNVHHIGDPDASVRDGHAFYVKSSDNLFEGNEIHHNAGAAFAIYSQYDVGGVSRNTLRRNKVYSNGLTKVDQYAVTFARGDRNVFVNNLVYDNSGGVQLYSFSTNLKVLNNTVFRNVAEGISLQYYGENPVVQNNIVLENGRGSIVDHGGGSGSSTSSNNLCDASGLGCDVSGDPLFVAPGDFHLQSDASAAAGRGANLSSELQNDFDGRPRPATGPWTIGAYEVGSLGSRPSGPVGLRVQ